MPTLTTQSCTLNYRDEGAGDPAIVFLHGWCDSAAVWERTFPAFSATYRCLAPEMRGHGASGMPTDHAFFPEALSNDVVAICEAAGVVRPVLVGHSFGGYLAAEVVRRFPGFARAVVVEDRALNMDAFATAARQMESVFRSPETHAAFREQLYRMLMPEGTPASVVEEVLAVGRNTPPEVGMALFATLFEYSESELRERGQALMRALEAQPSLVIHRAPSPDYDALLHSHAPSAELAVISGGHWIHIEHPDAFAERLHTFIESL